MVEQLRNQSNMLSEVVRELQESEQAAWRAANEARDQAVREAQAMLLADDQPFEDQPVAKLRAELAAERQASTRMQQLLRAQEEKINLLEQMLQKTAEAPSTPSGLVGAPSWLPQWLGSPAGGPGAGSGIATSGGAGGVDQSARASGGEELPPWSRWLPLPRSSAATPIKQPKKYEHPQGDAAARRAAIASAAGRPQSSAASAAAAAADADADAAAAAANAAESSEWKEAAMTAARLELELRTAPSPQANAAVEAFLDSFLRKVEGSVPLTPSQSGAAAGADGGGGSGCGTDSLSTPVRNSVGTAIGTPRGVDAYPRRGHAPVEGDTSPPSSSSCAARRGVQPCVVGLGAALEDRVGPEPSPPVTLRGDSATSRSAGGGAGFSSACSTSSIALSSQHSSDAGVGSDCQS